MRVIALDDEPLALQIIADYCQNTEGIILEKYFTRSKEAIHYLSENPVDLLFLDIHMPSISGIDFYKKLPEKVMAIFTTAYTEYAIEAFNLNIVDYLLKPFTLERFQQAVHKAHHLYKAEMYSQTEEEAFLYVRVNYALTPILIADITFIEALDNYIKINGVQHKPLMLRMSLKTILEQLPPKRFIRVHKSYVVAIRHIEKVRNKIITIQGASLPIGKNFETEFFNKVGLSAPFL